MSLILRYNFQAEPSDELEDRMADFDDVDVPEIPKTFKSEYEQTLSEYFRLTGTY